jgi:hypothetical protein
LAIDAHVPHLGGPELVVDAVAPRAVEADAVGRVGGQERRLGTVEETGDIVGVRRVPDEQTISPSTKSAPGLT